MKYSQGPRTKAKRSRNRKPKFEVPFTVVEKEIHGQLVKVKVYEPAYAQGDRLEQERLGLKEPNRFSRDRGDGLKRKAGRMVKSTQ